VFSFPFGYNMPCGLFSFLKEASFVALFGSMG
jgi:hypothetical protein